MLVVDALVLVLPVEMRVVEVEVPVVEDADDVLLLVAAWKK